MSPSIYVVTDDGRKLVEMAELPYELEDVLQQLLQDYPDLLSGDDPSRKDRKYLLVEREAGIADREGGSSRWNVDHLFLDQKGVPTLVEVKRSSDTRIRREVVGQMLDYAANAVVFWPVEKLRATFEATTADAEGRLQAFIGDEEDPKSFWDKVKTNLEAHKLRLVFVADEVPLELQRVVEFLNEQMRSTEVIALEVKRYGGEGFQTLVSRTIGRTAAAQVAKGTPEARKWDEASFLEELEAKDTRQAKAARSVLVWAEKNLPLESYGSGAKMGSVFRGREVGGTQRWPFALWSYGVIEIQFQYLQQAPGFAERSDREELARRLNAIPGVLIGQDRLEKRPSFSLLAVADDENLELFLSAMEWTVQELEKAASMPPPTA